MCMTDHDRYRRGARPTGRERRRRHRKRIDRDRRRGEVGKLSNDSPHALRRRLAQSRGHRRGRRLEARRCEIRAVDVEHFEQHEREDTNPQMLYRASQTGERSRGRNPSITAGEGEPSRVRSQVSPRRGATLGRDLSSLGCLGDTHFPVASV